MKQVYRGKDKRSPGHIASHVKRHCACTIHVLYMYNTCTIHVQYMYNTCTVHVQYIYNTCTIHVLYMYNTCIYTLQEGYSTITCEKIYSIILSKKQIS